MSSRTSSRSTLTTVPSTMSPSLKYLMVSSIAARNASSVPKSSSVTFLVLAVLAVLPDAPWRPWTIVGCVRTTADLLPAEVRGPRVHRPAYLLPYHTVQPSPDTRTVIRCARGQRAHDRSPAGDQTGRRRRGDHARQPALVGRPGRRLPGRTRAVPG